MQDLRLNSAERVEYKPIACQQRALTFSSPELMHSNLSRIDLCGSRCPNPCISSDQFEALSRSEDEAVAFSGRASRFTVSAGAEMPALEMKVVFLSSALS
jgi:hypothetical protein